MLGKAAKSVPPLFSVAEQKKLWYTIGILSSTKEGPSLAKRIAALLTALLCLSLSACSAQGKEKTALTVGGAQIGSELFAYYFDKAVAAPAQYGLTEESSGAEFVDIAVQEVTRYVAVNTLFVQYGLQLTNAEKTEIAETVDALWVAFGNHYQKVGISRATLSKIQTCAAYEDALFYALFDKGTENAEAEATLRRYFAENYIIFRSVSAFFITADAAGSELVMTDAQKTELINTFGSLAGQITDIGSFESIPAEQGYSAAATVLLKKGQSGYPDGFFDAVQAMEGEKATAVAFGDSVFLVWKFDPAQREQEYADCRTTCLKDIYAADAEALFTATEDSLTVERNDKVVQSFADNIAYYG